MKNTLTIIGVVIVLGIAGFLVYNRIDNNKIYICGAKNPELNCKKCLDNGGKIIPHSFGNSCEIKAKDAGKTCTYDNECQKNLCIYNNSIQNNTAPGRCVEYENEEGIRCHRPKGSSVRCNGDIS